jgi:hypothetical protein
MKEFIGDAIPPYAILSHTWSDDEVLFRDIDRGRYQQRSGFPKLRYTLQQTFQDGYEWAWVDTCCIDKSSSAELQEAINSMFAWYRNSVICYVYLADVKGLPLNTESDELGNPLTTELQASRWFTQGWTLEELIAPRRSRFFNATWAYPGESSKLQLMGFLGKRNL